MTERKSAIIRLEYLDWSVRFVKVRFEDNPVEYFTGNYTHLRLTCYDSNTRINIPVSGLASWIVGNDMEDINRIMKTMYV